MSQKNNNNVTDDIKSDTIVITRTRFTAILNDAYSSGSWRVFIVILIFFTGMATTAPHVTIIMTNFFAQNISGINDVDCTSFPLGEQPNYCREARSKAVLFSAIQDLIAYGVIAFFTNPIIGTWSDSYGRKAFMFLGTFFHLLPKIVFVLHYLYDFSLYWHYPAVMLAMGFLPEAMFIAYIADLVKPESKNLLFTGFLACTALGLVFASMFKLSGLVTDYYTASLTGIGLLVFLMLLITFWLPESVSGSTKEMAKQRIAQEKLYVNERQSHFFYKIKKDTQSFWHSANLLFKNNLFKYLSICIMAATLVMIESGELMLQYLQEVAAFNAEDQAKSLVITGLSILSSPILVFILLRLLNLSEPNILMLCFTGIAFQQLILAFCASKIMAFLALSFAPFSVIVTSVVSAIKSNLVPLDEQGAMQGAITGIKSFVKGFGPLIFWGLFVSFRNDNFYFPGAPMILSLIIQLFAFNYAFKIKKFQTKVKENQEVQITNISNHEQLEDQLNSEYKL